MNVEQLKITEFDLENHTVKHISYEEIQRDSKPEKIYWISIHSHEKELFEKITTLLNLNLPPEFIALVSENKSLGQIIDFDDDLILRIPFAKKDYNLPAITFQDSFIYLDANFVITIMEDVNLIQQFEKNSILSIRHAKTTGYFLFMFIEIVINNISEVLFDYEMLIEDFDVKQSEENYTKIVNTKKAVSKVKWSMIGIRELLRRIIGRKISVISLDCRNSLKNLEEHIHIIIYEADSIIEELKTILSQIDNGLMVRLNETMRILTAFSLVILPLTLITGIYGMNFQWMPELKWHYGYFASLVLIFICAITLIYFFKKKKWF